MHARHRTVVIAIAVACAVAGMEIHNVAELGVPFLLWPENVIPVLVYVGLGVALVRWPASRAAASLTLGWAMLNLVIGGVVSVLPLPFLPFIPVQTVGHYAAHVVYTVSQVPLVLVAFASLRGLSPARRATI